MGTKALHFTGETKILRTAGNKAAHTCAEDQDPETDCCKYAWIDLTFSGMIDCGLYGGLDCGFLNGTHAVSYTGVVGDKCVWSLPGKQIDWDVVANTIRIRVGSVGLQILCFDATISNMNHCSDIPQYNIPNSQGAGDCSTVPFPKIEGYDGTVDIEWT